MKKRLETKRLILRPWEDTDADALYQYAKDDKVGPVAGWPVHTCVENSADIIRNVLSKDGTYAVILKETGLPIGSVGIMAGKESSLGLADTEAEIGYWIGVPYWGMGLIPEAVRELLHYAFHELSMKKMWCGYYDGNEKSHRVQEKCGFLYHHTIPDMPCKLMNDNRTCHVSCVTKEQWI